MDSCFFWGYYSPRCRNISYMKIPAATETFNDCISPRIGRAALTSAKRSKSALIPVSSEPIISNVGFLKSTPRYDVAPFSVAAHTCMPYCFARLSTVFRFDSRQIFILSNAPEDVLMASSLSCAVP